MSSSTGASAEAPKSGLREQLLGQRYLAKDEAGQVTETPAEMFARVARAIASAEKAHGATQEEMDAATAKFGDMMEKGLFLPNSPTLMNAGRPEGLLSACFVLTIDDSIGGIFEALTQSAMVQCKGGGVGFAFDSLRPTGDLIRSTGGPASGPIAFWRVFAETTTAIEKGSRRRGANMGMMSVAHPDILKFITAKQDLAVFSCFNISVKLPDEFLTAVETNPARPHVVTNFRTGVRYLLPKSLDIARYTLADLLPEGTKGQEVYTAGEIWNLIVTCAHATGEPGVRFIDRVNRENPTPHVGSIQATNPCGEQPLLGEESCNLGSLDIARFVLPDGSDLDWGRLAEVVPWAVRFLDDVIDANWYPVEAIRRMSGANRKIGLGIMGLADALVLLGIRYDSQAGMDFARKLMRFIQEHSHQASEELARKRGVFPNWKGSVWDVQHRRPMRNASCTTIAPTGSLSLIAETSAGIEPIFSLAYKRRALDGKEFVQVYPLLERVGTAGGWMTSDVLDALLAGKRPAEVPGIPPRMADALVTAHEVSPEVHVRMQAAVQEFTDNAVSKTANLPNSATVADVDRIYRLAYQLGCKGITVYRDGSRQAQVLTAVGKEKAKAAKPAAAPAPAPAAASPHPRDRGRVTSGKTYKFRMGCGQLYVTVNQDDHGVCEVLANLGKGGGCASQTEAACRAISSGLRSGVHPEELIYQLRGIRCLSTMVARTGDKEVDVLSCPDAIGRALEEYMGGSALAESAAAGGRPCPDCGRPLRREAGCFVCHNCGYSKCG